jgi:CubicO group peptidase (beta-lactamase class C family)
MSHGFAEKKLAYLTSHIDRYVDDGKFPGVLCLVSRRGEEAFFHAYGKRDVERSIDITRDTVFRIYSMSKPITSIALMMLYEQGHFQLDDPVARYLPAWENLRVYDSGAGNQMRTSASATPVTIKHLLTHTSGLTYGFMGEHPVNALYREQGIGGLAVKGTLEEMVQKLADIPLLFTPGTRWNYGVSTDVCGYLVQAISGQPLDDFVRERITGPLSMTETDYQVVPSARDRFAACYEFTAGGGYELRDDPETSPHHERPTFISGGGGMVSTIDDYSRFARMLLNKGELDGVRILGRKTVEYMTTNHLPGNVDLAAMGQPVFSETPFEGIGFGLGFSVVVDPAAANVLDSPGEFAWGGVASTYFWVDPVEDLFVIFMTQLIPSSTYPIRRELKTLVYQAIVD